jgi:hypothetical protein
MSSFFHVFLLKKMIQEGALSFKPLPRKVTAEYQRVRKVVFLLANLLAVSRFKATPRIQVVAF